MMFCHEHGRFEMVSDRSLPSALALNPKPKPPFVRYSVGQKTSPGLGGSLASLFQVSRLGLRDLRKV